MDITPDFLRPYFTGNKKHLAYRDSVNLFDELRIHANGEMPVNLIQTRRPSETEEIFEYRRQIYEPVTMEPLSSIIRSLSKIRRSSDWTIKYDRSKVSASIADDETLEQYCEYNFPMHTSLTNWAFSILLKNLLIDPNAVILVAPRDTDVAPNQYLQPYPTIFNSNQVYEYIFNEVAVLLSVEKTDKNGNVFIVVTPQEIQRWEQDGLSTNYINTDNYLHGLDEMPVFRIEGIFKKAYSNDILFESHIQPIVPRLNEAAREYNDMQAEVVQHIFSEKWEFATQKCEECLDPMTGVSTGRVKSGNGKRMVTCTKCNGTGMISTGPFRKIVLRSAKESNGETATPIPPAGYIQKQIDIVQLQDARIDKHIYKALSAVNMQFLAQSPLNQSGTAKEVDKDELNNFIYAIAEDIVKTLDKIYYFTNEFRYLKIIPSPKLRAQQLPVIPVPEKFDILSTSYLVDEMQKCHDSKVSSVILTAYEIDFCNKKFYTNPAVRDELEAIFKLDPLPATNDDEKFVRKQGGGITDVDYVISCNISRFVRQALFEDPNFYTKHWDQQRAKMEEYAQKVIDTNALKPKTALPGITVPSVSDSN